MKSEEVRNDYKTMISIIDYGAGNLRSVEKALEYLGGEVKISCDKDEILASDKIILPGVGAFGDAAKKLKAAGMFNTVYDAVSKNIPLLGICLGFQLLFEESEEGEGEGLGIIKGRVLKIPDYGLKIPHMGWNSINIKENSRLFNGISSGEYVYFVHSYYADANDKSDVCGVAEYGVRMDVAVEKGDVFGFQFHPEKSSAVGLKMLDNFIKL